MRKFSFLLLLVLFGCEDPEIAKIRKEAENGNPIAQFNLAEQYYNGGKLKQDQNEGIKWYEKSAKQGNIEAIKKLSTIYINKKQYEKAIAYINEICNYSKKKTYVKTKSPLKKIIIYTK
ncbi:sel1 repeat family protein [Haemophilus parainfluenzae]|uniref:tetratricopeptide repeat protein n=1 Tax=Haemophilus parainfluenzae TaxID=729 RepID=UPI0018A6303A|nr:SEL1-like repeat protein [Haemophilus parainfluenzae]QOR23791.1 sel1 repeat family protein [Haemophilus parainfluenzae]